MDAVLHRVSSPTFVGRTDELAALDGALGRAGTGVPAFAFVAGESGVGKSRLVGELEARAQDAGARVLIGHCLELGGTAIPYAPLAGALRPVARELADLPSSLPAVSRAALSELLPELGDGGAAPAAETEGSRGHQARVFEALLALLDRLGEGGPVVLVLEDLHWADASTRDFLTFLVRNARTEPLLLVVTYRSDELHRRHPLRPLLAELERVPGVERVGLERFTRAEVDAQVAAILDGEVPSGLAERLFERAEGNALYTEELLAASGESGAGELPETLRDALLSRIERLPAATQEVVRVIAVEHPMPHGLLAELSPLDAAETTAAVRDAIAQQILVTDRSDQYAFRHALVGEAVYGDLLPGERSALHMRLAETVERDPSVLGEVTGAAVAAQLACHWHAAHDVPRALGASVEAGRAAKRVYAFREAQRHYERALELWDRVPDAEERAGCDRIDVLRHAAVAAAHCGEAARSVALMRKATTEVDAEADPVRAAFLFERLGNYLRWAGETEDGFAAYDAAMALLPPGDNLERARLMEYRARGKMLRGQHTAAEAEAQEALALAARVPGAEAVAGRALNTLGSTRVALGATEEGLQLLRRSCDIAKEIGPPVDHVIAVTNLSENLDLSGRTEEALAEVRACMELMRAYPERTNYDTFLECQGVNHLVRLGRLDELEPGLPVEAFGDRTGSTPSNVAELRARVWLITGDVSRAECEIGELRRLTRGTRDPQWLEPLYGHTAVLALLREQGAEARAAVAEGLSAIRDSEDGLRIVRLLWIGLRAEADLAEARAFDEDVVRGLEAALAEAETRPAQYAEGPLYAAMARAEAARARGAGDPAAWLDVAAGFDALSLPWPAAYARWRAGEALVLAGDRAAAAGPLSAARAAATALGAAPLIGEIDALARRARVTLEGPAEQGSEPEPSPVEQLGLTPREHEVLLLLAEGRTNREIGETLFMSEKTASVHVSRILAKLGVGGRVEAAAVAHRLGLTPV
jgi:DNA-binding CsgD family transcriptional regulator/tetratricopeptide (TPR) repeat protein